MPTKKYTDIMRAEAMILLAVNHYDTEKVGQLMNIPRRVVQRWNRQFPTEAAVIPIQVMVERAITHL